MEIKTRYHVEATLLDGTARRGTEANKAMPLWLAQVIEPGSPGCTGRFTGDTAYDVLRQAAEYVQELERIHS